MKRYYCLMLLLIGAISLSSCWQDKPQSAAGEARNIHALFVGIDEYQFSRQNLSSAEFDDLRGAVGDAERFKLAIAELYGADLKESATSSCSSQNSQSMTITNSCATRDKILAALAEKIAALKSGDTLLFYFAGHGSQYRDEEVFDQDSGYNGTILPYDARDPNGLTHDIYDVELKALKDRATAKGIYFISIFDSCNSATATRNVGASQSRNVPPLITGGPPVSGPVTPAVTPAVTGGIKQNAPSVGYWVHMAAAQDGEVAQETVSGAIGKRAGVFTSALIETLRLPGMRGATFGDIIREVQIRVAQNGHSAQNPSAEGELTATLGTGTRAAILFDATANDGSIILNAGTTSGITKGSAFAFYASQADAIKKTKQLAIGSVVSVDQNMAQISAKFAPGIKLPPKMAAEQTAYFFPAEAVKVSNLIGAGAEHDAVKTMLGQINFVKTGGDGEVQLVMSKAIAGTVELRAADGALLSDTLGNLSDIDFDERLRDELQKVARVQQLLALRTDMISEHSAADSGVNVCVDVMGYRPTACPPLERGGVRRIAINKASSATIMNTSRKPLYVYLLAIDPRNAISLILPKDGEFDQKLKPGVPYRRENFSFDTAGTYRFILISTEQPIRADAFNQSGNGTRDIARCISPIERLLCSASNGTRDPGVTSVGNWSASVSSAIVEP